MTSNRSAKKREAVVTVELAILLPLLSFLFIIAIDFARVFYPYLTITNAASNGAVYGSLDKVRSLDLLGIQQAALADTTNLQPQPLVTSLVYTDNDGQDHVQVTVQWRFRTITKFPGVPSEVWLKRTVHMRVIPDHPNNAL